MLNAMRVCSYLWLVFYVCWLLAALRNKRAVERVDWGARMRYVVPVAVAYFLMFGREYKLPGLEYRIIPRTPAIGIAAIVITVTGMLFAAWARVYLGSNWSSVPTIKQEHQLIRGGPYRFVRHPIYSGFLLAMFGTFLANGRVRGAVSVVMVWIAWQVKAGMEEKFMVRTFGAQYEDYRRTTGALIPRFRS
jgi:protein-S-isoprenylcysteine O-methyltransferase Ste14